MTDYYVDRINGSDAADGLTELTAWATMQHAADTAIAADRVYVQYDSIGDVPYSEAVTYTAKTIEWIGYGEDIDDGVQVVMDGGSTLASAFQLNRNAAWVSMMIKNFEIRNYTSHGIEILGTSGNGNSNYVNLHVHTNGGNGLQVGGAADRWGQFMNLDIHDNVGGGIVGTAQHKMCLAASKVHGNGGKGIDNPSGNWMVMLSEVYENGDDQIAVNTGAMALCAIDGTGAAANRRCIEMVNGWTVVSSGLVNATGDAIAGGYGANALGILNVGFWGNGNDLPTQPFHGAGTVTTDPEYPGSGDYTPGPNWRDRALVIGCTS